MQLNYFGCLRVTLGLLPGMVRKKRKGHIVNISSIGVLTNAPRFSAYVASKAALDAWTRCAVQRVRRSQGVSFTTINMPLVRTPMIAPTQIYNNVPARSVPSRPATWWRRPASRGRCASPHAWASPARCCMRFAPRVAQIVMNTSFRMFPDSEAAKGQRKPGAQAAALDGGDCDAADDARHPLLTTPS
jgi:short-subunit dehydrogenase